MAAIDNKLSQKIRSFILDYKKTRNRELTAIFGKRWIKLADTRPHNRSAYYFIDTKPGWTYGNLHEAESWSRPRAHHLGNLLKKGQ